ANIEGMVHPHGKPLPTYKVHDYHKDWVAGKKKLDDKLFTQKLGAKLDDLNSLYSQMKKASDKSRPALIAKYQPKAAEVEKIVVAYRNIVKSHGSDAQALKVLASIDGEGVNNAMLPAIKRDIEKSF